MALTATATRATYEIVKERLSLHNPVVIGVSPDRPDIFFVFCTFNGVGYAGRHFVQWFEGEKNKFS